MARNSRIVVQENEGVVCSFQRQWGTHASVMCIGFAHKTSCLDFAFFKMIQLLARTHRLWVERIIIIPIFEIVEEAPDTIVTLYN
jgi:hypothetical protein